MSRESVRDLVIHLGTEKAVFNDRDFQKQLQPELEAVTNQIDKLGLTRFYEQAINEMDKDQPVSMRTFAFVTAFNDAIDQINTDFKGGVLNENSVVSSIVGEYIENRDELSEDSEGKYFLTYESEGDGIDRLVSVPADVILECALNDSKGDSRLTYDESSEAFTLTDNNGNETLFEKDENGNYSIDQDSRTQDLKNDIAFINSNSIETVSEKFNSYKIDSSDLYKSISDHSDKAARLDSSMLDVNAYSHLSRKNVVGQYYKLHAKILAYQNKMRLNNEYITKTELFVDAYTFLSGLNLETIILSVLEIISYKSEGIMSAEDLKKYKETGSIERPEAPSIDVDKTAPPEIEFKNDIKSAAEILSSAPEKTSVTIDGKDFEINNDTVYKYDKDTKEAKLETNGKTMSPGDVTFSVKGIDAISKDRINLMHSKDGKVLIEDKLIVSISGRVDKDTGKEIKENISETDKDLMTNDKDPDKKIAGVDKLTTVGYLVYDPKTDKAELLDWRFEHISGEKFGIDKNELSLNRTQDNISKIDVSLAEKFSEAAVEKLSPSQDEKDTKLTEINERLGDLEYLRDEVGLSDKEKAEINEEISDLEKEKTLLSENPDKDSSLQDKADNALAQRDICSQELKESKVLNDYKDDIDKSRLDKIANDIRNAENKLEKSNSKDERDVSSKELIEARQEYIDKSDLSDKDKGELKKAVTTDLASFDNKLQGVSFDNKDKAVDVVKSIYKTELEKPDNELKSEVCKDAADAVKPEVDKKEQDIESIKAEFGGRIDADKLSEYKDQKDPSVSPMVEVTRDKDGNPEKIISVDYQPIEKDGNSYSVTRTDEITFKDGSASIDTSLLVNGVKVQSDKYSIELEGKTQGNVTVEENKTELTGVAKDWVEAPGSEKDKINAFLERLDNGIDKAYDGENSQRIKDNIRMDMGLIGVRNENSPQENADMIQAFLSTEIDINNDGNLISVNDLVGDDKLEVKVHIDGPATKEELIPINGIDPSQEGWREDLIQKQDSLTATYIEKDADTTVFITDFMATKGEFLGEDGYANLAVLDGIGLYGTDNVDIRIEEAIEAIGRYASNNPDKQELIANAITKMCRDTGCVSKTIELADSKLSDVLSEDQKAEIFDKCFEKIDEILDEVYGIDRDEYNDIENADTDSISTDEKNTINFIGDVVSTLIPVNADDIKSKLTDAVDKVKGDDESSGISKREFLNVVGDTIEQIKDNYIESVQNDTEFDIDRVDTEPKDDYDDYNSLGDIFRDDED